MTHAHIYPSSKNQTSHTNRYAAMQKNRPPHTSPTSRATAPATDFFRGDQGYALHVELPGVAPDDLKLDARDGRLVLEASSEALGRRFSRSYRLPEDADVPEISARLELGVLHVSIPRQAARTPVKIQVNASPTAG